MSHQMLNKNFERTLNHTRCYNRNWQLEFLKKSDDLLFYYKRKLKRTMSDNRHIAVVRSRDFRMRTPKINTATLHQIPI